MRAERLRLNIVLVAVRRWSRSGVSLVERRSPRASRTLPDFLRLGNGGPHPCQIVGGERIGSGGDHQFAKLPVPSSSCVLSPWSATGRKKNSDLAHEAGSGRITRTLQVLQLETEIRAAIRCAARTASWRTGKVRPDQPATI